MINDEHLPALQGMFPSWITTVSNDGEPNTTVISQIWHVNETEVALSFQFFNKTKKNISQNPFAFATITNPASFDTYTLELKYKQLNLHIFLVLDPFALIGQFGKEV